MTLQDKLANAYAEIDNAKRMMEKRLLEAVTAFEADTGLTVRDVRRLASGPINATVEGLPTFKAVPEPHGREAARDFDVTGFPTTGQESCLGV